MTDLDHYRADRHKAQMRLARAVRYQHPHEDLIALRSDFAASRAKVALLEALEGYPRLTPEQTQSIINILIQQTTV